MPNKIKFSPTGTETDSIFTSNVAIGISEPNIGGGPSSTTSFYTAPAIPSGGYVAYNNGVAFTASNDTDLIDYMNSLGAGAATIEAALVWAAANNITVVNRDYENIVTDDLVLNLDAGFTPSYPTDGTTWYGMSGTNNGTLTNGPTFNIDGSITFDGTNDSVSFNSLPTGFQEGMTNYTISIWFKLITKKEAPLLEMGSTNGDYRRIMFWLTNDSPKNRLYALGASSNGIGYRYSSVYLDLDTMYNAVYTYNNTGTVSKLYINGVEDTGLTNQNTNGLLISLANTWRIGADSVYGQSYCQNANIYNVLMYTKTLTFSEVLQNFNAQKARFGL